MKVFSAVLVAVCCATIVSAAPSSSAFSFKDFALSKFFAEIENTFKIHVPDLECIRNVIERVAEDSEIKVDWDETRETLDNLINVEWLKCLDLESVPEQQGCQVTVVGKGVEAVFAFVKKLASESKWRLIKDITDGIKDECFENATFFEAEEEAEVKPSLLEKGAEKVKCIADAITEAVDETEYAAIWADYKKDLKQHHERFEACKNETNHIDVAKCVAKEAKQGFEILGRFFSNLQKVNKETYDRVKSNIKEKCFQ